MPLHRTALALVIFLCAVTIPASSALAQFPQQGAKLVGTGAVGAAKLGYSIALSADGTTAIVGAREDNSLIGAAWVFIRNGGVWSQQGPKLVGSGAAAGTTQAVSVSISADGNTAIVGGETSSSVGAAWIWTRSDGVWTQQGSKLVGTGAAGFAGQGIGVAMSGDGNTALVGGFTDNSGTGALWVWTRSGTTWTQQGPKLVGSGNIGNAQQGYSVALSFDGDTAIAGGFNDDNLRGAAWVWSRSGGVWSQQGSKLVGSNGSSFAGQGKAVAISSDGNTAVVGGYLDGNNDGAAWIWTRTAGVWTQQGPKLTAPVGVSSALVGWSVSLSADGNTALLGAPRANSFTGAAWVWTRSGSVWTRQSPALVGTGAIGNASQGSAVALSGDAATAMIGGTGDNGGVGAAWPFSAVTATVPTLSLDKSSLAFSAVDDGVAFTTQTSAQTIRLTQSGSGPLSWTAVSNVPWLVVSPSEGSASATLTVSTQFVPGLVASQIGVITLTPGATTTTGPLHLTAALNVLSPGTSAAPFGWFDTPIEATTGVTGSIAVTGWALDDVEVTRVRILRAPVPGEPAETLVFIGDAVQVDGARPDVQAAFPSTPRNTRAGWGYLMLTNFLPSLGDGTFTLYAVADDADGHSTTLGTKTITCTNSTATAPTGAIDTPVQGGVVSGNVTNFGWVLSPAPAYADPPDGGTVQVVIDGAFLSTAPSEWTGRSDLTALFPADRYPGITNALGVASFDSTSLPNGVHTIAWLVTDNLGNASGIGSRYFTVSNGSLTLAPASPVVRAASSITLAMSAPVSAPIRGRRGFDPGTPLQTYPSPDNRVTVQAEELDRIELQLGDGSGYRHVGYLRAGTGLESLPIGSALDPVTGAFTWMPGVGFSGAYDFVFVQAAGGGPGARRDVRIVLNAKGSNRVGTQTVIDTAPAVAGASFDIAGWAADLDSASDRGVDTVHVWAYRVDAGHHDDPIWLGAAAYGGARPDVAAVFGDRFLRSGYGLTVHGLPTGTYDIAVFAYSTVLGRFAPAKTVRVTVR